MKDQEGVIVKRRAAAEPLVAFRFRCSDGADHLAWADGQSFCLPASVLRDSKLDKHLTSANELRLPAEPLGAVPTVAQDARLYAAFTGVRPGSSRLPFSYQLIPPRLRVLAASAIGRWQRRRSARWAAFPRWPIDLGVDFLADVVTGQPGPFTSGPTPVILSHDLDSPEGLTRLVESFLELEEAVGARSTNFIVPCGWPIDHGLLSAVKQRGHEVGVHGYDHANRTAFAPPEERRRRLDAARPLIARYGASGYRAPSLLRTRELLADLASLYAYDSSIPTTGGLFPIPNNGCASARPFLLEGIAEIPLSLPRDGSLRFLGYSPRAIGELWIECAEAIAKSGGVVVLLTHCEARFSGNAEMLSAYRCFLDYVAAAKHLVWSTPEEVLRRAAARRVA